MFEITDSASRVIAKQLEKQQKPGGGLRIAVKAGGCSGFSYVFAFSQPRWLSRYQVYTVVDYLTTMFSDAVQAQLPSYGMAPLPPGVLATSRRGIDNIGIQ